MKDAGSAPAEDPSADDFAPLDEGLSALGEFTALALELADAQRGLVERRQTDRLQRRGAEPTARRPR